MQIKSWNDDYIWLNDYSSFIIINNRIFWNISTSSGGILRFQQLSSALNLTNKSKVFSFEPPLYVRFEHWAIIITSLTAAVWTQLALHLSVKHDSNNWHQRQLRWGFYERLAHNCYSSLSACLLHQWDSVLSWEKRLSQ